METKAIKPRFLSLLIKTTKMKYYPFAFFILTVLNCTGQDTVIKSSRHSISFTGGVNIIHPVVSSYTEGYNNLIIPSSSVQPWFLLSYSTTFHRSKYSSMGMKFGIGYIQYRYTGVVYEYAPEAWPPPPTVTMPALQQIDDMEINTGLFVNEKLFKRVGWYNELDVVGSIQLYSEFNDLGPNASWGWPGYYPLFDLTNEDHVNLYLMYQTGIRISISKNISLTPVVEFPLVNIMARSITWNNLFSSGYTTQVNAFASLRTGIMFTYNFN